MARKGGRRSTRREGSVLVDTNPIIEAWRVNAWRAAAAATRPETVEECVIETQTGFQKRRQEQQIDRDTLLERLKVHTVSKVERAAALAARRRDRHARRRREGALVACARPLRCLGSLRPRQGQPAHRHPAAAARPADRIGAVARRCGLPPEDAAQTPTAATGWIARSPSSPSAKGGSHDRATAPTTRTPAQGTRPAGRDPAPRPDWPRPAGHRPGARAPEREALGLVRHRLSRARCRSQSGPSAADRREEDDLLDEGDPLVGDDRGADSETGPARAADDAPDDEAPVVRIRAPSSVGLTVLLDASVREVEVNLSWGDYVTVPPSERPRSCSTRRRMPGSRVAARAGQRDVLVPVPADGSRSTITVPNSGGAQRPSGALQLELHARPYDVTEPDGTQAQPARADADGREPPQLRAPALSGRRPTPSRSASPSAARPVCYPRTNMRGFGSKDIDEAIADLHYRDVC